MATNTENIIQYTIPLNPIYNKENNTNLYGGFAKDGNDKGNQYGLFNVNPNNANPNFPPNNRNVQGLGLHIGNAAPEKAKNSPPLSKKEKYKLLFNAYKKATAEVDILNYGKKCFYASKCLSQEIKGILNDSLLQRHSISSLLRTKMVDWMYEVLSAYRCNDETYFLSVYIMDMYFTKTTKTLSSNDVHLIGMVSMFIATKFEEVYPLLLKKVVKDVGHDIFKEKDYLNMEQEIYKTIGIDSLVTTSTYDILKTLFFDFFKHFLNGYPIEYKKYSISIKETAFYFAKIMLHYENAYAKESIYNAVGCILAGAEYYKEKNPNNFDVNMDKLFSNWILFLCEENDLKVEDIKSYSKNIHDFYADYLRESRIDHNVKKKTPLKYE